MKILHIANDFAYTSVHSELYKHLDDLGVEQVVFTPLKDASKVGSNSFESNMTDFVYAPVIKGYHRYLFQFKIKETVKAIEHQIDLNNVSAIHATTLFTDGAAALALKNKYGIPYIVAVRNTDLNAFLKYRPLLWDVHRKVIQNASKVIFITPMLKKRLISHPSLKDMRDALTNKSEIIPNGLHEYWLNHISLERNSNHSVAYVGWFDKNKNILRLIDAVLQLKEEIPDIHLNLAGGGGSNHEKIINIVEKYPQYLSFHGKIMDKDKLRRFYLENRVYAMPSLHETFGLVYLEAMSQGLSVLYSKNEGIDGMFHQKVGEAVDPSSVKAIAASLKLLLTENDYDYLQSSDFEKFDWESISEKYKSIYQSISIK